MKTDTWKNRDWITTQDFSREEFDTILDLAGDLKQRFLTGEPHDLLKRKTLFMLFYNSSLRTRNSFEAGMTQLGGHAHFLDVAKIYTPTFAKNQKASHSEEIMDTARTLSRMGHGMAIRCFGDAVDWQWGMGKSGLVGNYSLLETMGSQAGVFRGGTGSFVSEKTKEQLNKETQEILQGCLKEVEDLLRNESDLLDRFAQELLSKDELNYDEIEAIFKEFGKTRPS